MAEGGEDNPVHPGADEEGGHGRDGDGDNTANEHQHGGVGEEERELSEWLRETGEEAGIDLAFAAAIFRQHKLKLHMLGDVSDGEWVELVKEIGARIVLRRASVEVPLRAQRESLVTECSRLRKEKEGLLAAVKEAQDAVAQMQAQLDAARAELTRSANETRMCNKERDGAMAAMQEAEAKRSALASEIEQQSAARDAAVAERDAAVQAVVEAQAEKARLVEDIRLLQTQARPTKSAAPIMSPAPAAVAAAAPSSLSTSTILSLSAPTATTATAHAHAAFAAPPAAVSLPRSPLPAAPTPPSLATFESTPLPPLAIAKSPIASSQPPPAPAAAAAPARPQSQLALMSGQPWFHSNITRLMCEAVLTHKSAQPGDFMVRASESEPGHYTLSVRLRGAPSGSLPIKHHRIREVTGKYCVAAGELYGSIVELVAGHIAKGAAAEIFLARPARLLPVQCIHCGALGLPNAPTCLTCGKAFPSDSATAPTSPAPAMAASGMQRSSSIYASVTSSSLIRCACGAMLGPGDKFCGECGIKVSVPVPAGPEMAAPALATVILCKGCRAVIPRDSRFCEKCGTAVSSS